MIKELRPASARWTFFTYGSSTCVLARMTDLDGRFATRISSPVVAIHRLPNSVSAVIETQTGLYPVSFNTLDPTLVEEFSHVLPLPEPVTHYENRIVLISTTDLDHVRRLLACDPPRKIEAIKLVRSATKCGLKEAKDYVEGLDHG